MLLLIGLAFYNNHMFIYTPLSFLMGHLLKFIVFMCNVGPSTAIAKALQKFCRFSMMKSLDI